MLYVSKGKITLKILIQYYYSTLIISCKQVDEFFSKIIGLLNIVIIFGKLI